MKLSDDEYMLPEAVADSSRELAKLCNVSHKTVENSYYGYASGRLKTEKFIRIYVPND
jgi:hypothetical protein